MPTGVVYESHKVMGDVKHTIDVVCVVCHITKLTAINGASNNEGLGDNVSPKGTPACHVTNARKDVLADKVDVGSCWETEEPSTHNGSARRCDGADKLEGLKRPPGGPRGELGLLRDGCSNE